MVDHQGAHAAGYVNARAACFWASAAGASWTLAGYPLFLLALPERPWRRAEDEPRVSVIVPAFRERDALRAKLAALAALDYPRDRLEVIVAADEDEALVEIARSAYPDAIVLFSPERQGKVGGLNRALERAGGDIVLMTDANNVLDPASVRAAARHFADPAVWAVAGRRGEVESAYDRYEDLLRRLETRSGSVAAMSGEFMAVRRDRLPDRFPEGVVNDDFWLLCRIAREGGRVVYEPDAASVEEAVGVSAELARRSRIGAGRAMLLSELRGLPPGFAVRLVSHKVARLALPFLLVSALVSSASLARRRPYGWIAATQALVYALGAASAAGVEPPPGPARRASRIARQFLMGNAAVAMGVVRAARGRQSTRWQAVR